MNKPINEDFIKIKNSNYFSGIFSFNIIDDHIILTTDMYHDYVVQHNINSVKGLNFKYRVIEMIDEFDGEVEDSGKELWSHNSKSYREWKIIKI